MEQQIAGERIERLFELAGKRVREKEEGKELADRYVELARDIGMKYNVSIPTELQKSFCESCHSYLKPGLNCRVRINSRKSTVNYTCGECGHVNRYGF